MGWTKEQDAVLKKCVLKGMSFNEAAGEINERFKTSYTRNSCISRSKRINLNASKVQLDAARLNLKQSRKSAEKEQVASVRQLQTKIEKLSPQPRSKPRPLPHVEPMMVCEPVASIAPAVDPDDYRRVSLLDLKPDECRWPVTGWPADEPVTFCGRKRVSESYCDEHDAMKLRVHYEKVRA